MFKFLQAFLLLALKPQCWWWKAKLGPPALADVLSTLFLSSWTEFLLTRVLWACFFPFRIFFLDKIEVKLCLCFELLLCASAFCTEALQPWLYKPNQNLVLLFKLWTPGACSSWVETLKNCTVVKQHFPVKCVIAMQFILTLTVKGWGTPKIELLSKLMDSR